MSGLQVVNPIELFGWQTELYPPFGVDDVVCGGGSGVATDATDRRSGEYLCPVTSVDTVP